jgi:hypothetical protein
MKQRGMPRNLFRVWRGWGSINTIGEKIEKLKYNVGYQKIGDEFFIGGAYQSRTRQKNEKKSSLMRSNGVI